MEKLTLLSISKSEIKQVIKDRIKEDVTPVFVDTDVNFNEELYYGDLFSTLSKEDLDYDELKHLQTLIDTSFDAAYILVTE